MLVVSLRGIILANIKHMTSKILSIRLIDFRSFEDVNLKLDEVIVLIGSNNVGKTNLLRAIELLPPEKQIDTQRDLRRGSSRQSPELIYQIELDSIEKLPLYELDLPKTIGIKKTASSWEIVKDEPEPRRIDELLTEGEYYRNSTEGDVEIGTYILSPGKIAKDSLLSDDVKQSLTPVSLEEAGNEFHTEVSEIIKTKLPGIQNVWNPEESDFITEETPIDQILNDENLPVARLLIKAFEIDSSVGDYRQILPKGIHSEIQTFCQRATVAVNAILDKYWKFKPSIKLSINSSDSSLRVFFDQGKTGLVEPLFSSDGLQWLMSYFIRFGMTDVENRIILLDQPGDKLYPGGQKDLVELLENIGKKNQLVYSTHSPFMISKSKLGRNVRIISKPTDENGNQIGYSQIINEIKETDIRQSELLNSALGFVWTDFIPVGEFNILLEGKLDAAIVKNAEKQKAKKNGSTEIDFNRVVVRGVRGASNIGPAAKGLKIDGKPVFCVYDGDWSQPTPELLVDEKISLTEINKTWVDIEDLLPTDWIKEVFRKIATDLNIKLRYTKSLDGPGRGKKIKTYLKKKENTSANKTLISEFELRMIDFIELKVESEEDLPSSFFELNKKIIENIKYR